MTKLCIEITDDNIECWRKYKKSLGEEAERMAEEKGVEICHVCITDNDAISGLFDCVKEEGIFCWSLLWDIVERTKNAEDKNE
jgi:DUF971 family protein